MNAAVFCVGALKEKWQKDGCAEYLKRLTRYGRYEVVEVPDEPEPVKPSPALNAMVMEKEGRALLARLRPQDRVVALCIDARQQTSEQLAAFFRQREMSPARVVYVIGGSLGLHPDVLARADETLSMSQMTFPHQLARVMLLEQIYRAHKIKAGEKYHK